MHGTTGPSASENASDDPQPKRHILYRHWAKDGRLLYVGITNNPPMRLAAHRGGSRWWALVKWTSYEEFPSREALKAGETWAIKNENPKYNIQGRVHSVTSRQEVEPSSPFGPYRPITSNDLKQSVRLVHPLSREFLVYGNESVPRRAREWALSNRVYLLDSGYGCAHDFYLMRCPNDGRCIPHSDHTQTWVPAPDFSQFTQRSGADAPFILTQPYVSSQFAPNFQRPLGEAGPLSGESAFGSRFYSEEFKRAAQAGSATKIPSELNSYANAHGLEVSADPYDAWYYPGGCVSIRLTPGEYWQNAIQSPLEKETLSLMCAWRDDWPETIPEWLT